MEGEHRRYPGSVLGGLETVYSPEEGLQGACVPTLPAPAPTLQISFLCSYTMGQTCAVSWSRTGSASLCFLTEMWGSGKPHICQPELEE